MPEYLIRIHELGIECSGIRAIQYSGGQKKLKFRLDSIDIYIGMISTQFSATTQITPKWSKLRSVAKHLLETIGLKKSPKRMQHPEFHALGLEQTNAASSSVTLYRVIGLREFFKLRLGQIIFPHAGKDHPLDPEYLSVKAEKHAKHVPWLPTGLAVRAPKNSPFISMTPNQHNAFEMAQDWGSRSRWVRAWILAIAMPRTSIYATKPLSYESIFEQEVLTTGGYSWENVRGTFFKKDLFKD